MMSTFLSFAAGFAMRPIGALVLGGYIDRIGRRKGLILTLSIMACGTVLIAFGLWQKARMEEGFLTTELGAEAYGPYCRRVPMLVPFLPTR